MTRGSITGQVKALAMIVAMQEFIPNRHASLTEKDPPTPPAKPQIYVSAWRARQQQATTAAPQPGPAPADQDHSPGIPEPAPVRAQGEAAPPDPGPSQSTPNPGPSQPPPPPPFVPLLTSVPDARAPFSINKHPFGRRR